MQAEALSTELGNRSIESFKPDGSIQAFDCELGSFVKLDLNITIHHDISRCTFDRDLSIVDRLLWLLVVIAFLGIAVALTWNFWSQWRNEQVS